MRSWTKTTPDERQLVEGQQTNHRQGNDPSTTLERGTDLRSRDSPSWDDYVAATCAAQAEGYRLGFHAGLKYAADEADGKVLRERAAEVVLNAAKDMHVAALRRPAA